ncbi:hypothetical protein Tco_1574862, partial [Tanacetum coccineum]
ILTLETRDEYAVSLYVHKEDLYVIAVAMRGGQIYEFRGYKEFAGSKSLPYGEGYGDLSTRVLKLLSQPNDIHGLDTASSEQLEPYLRFSKQIHFKYYDQGSGSQGERVNAWLRRRKNCKRGVRHADSIIESLPSDAWNTVPASSKRLKDEVYYILRRYEICCWNQNCNVTVASYLVNVTKCYCLLILLQVRQYAILLVCSIKLKLGKAPFNLFATSELINIYRMNGESCFQYNHLSFETLIHSFELFRQSADADA